MTSSKTSTGPSKQALPYLTSATNNVTNAYNANAGNVSAATSTLGDNLGTVLGQTLNNSNLNAATGYYNGVLGQSADPTQNSLFMNALNDTNASTADAVNGSIGTRGLTGGSGQTQLLASQIAKADNSALLSQYNTNVSNQNTAASGLASAASTQDSGIQALLSYLSGMTTIPTASADSQANDIANLWGKSTTTTSTPSLLSSAEGVAGTAAKVAGLFSDRRLKRDIERLREDADGLGWYRFRYLWDDAPQEGVMADEVAALRPWALGAPVDGFNTVHYGLL